MAFVVSLHIELLLRLLCAAARKPPGFAFVEFEDKRDALDAVARLDGTYRAAHAS